MLRDLDDRIALSESLKLSVEIPAHFAADLAQCFVAMPSMPLETPSGTILLNDLPYTYLISNEEIFKLTRLHEAWQSQGSLDEIWTLPAYKDGKRMVLTFDPEDLKWLFFTIDKVIAGADSVPLLGSIIAELEVPAAS